jgi:hypothetical protein
MKAAGVEIPFYYEGKGQEAMAAWFRRRQGFLGERRPTRSKDQDKRKNEGLQAASPPFLPVAQGGSAPVLPNTFSMMSSCGGCW